MICFQLERLLQEAFYYANYQKACSHLEKIKGQITENEYNDLKTIMVYASPDYPDGGRNESLEELSRYVKNLIYKYTNLPQKDSIRCCPHCGSVLGLYTKKMIVITKGYSYDGSEQTSGYLTLSYNKSNSIRPVNVTKNRKKTPLYCLFCNKFVKYLEDK